MGKEKFVAGGGCFCALLIAGAIMIGCSFGVLGPTDMGLDYDSINIRINEVDLFENGRYFIGLGHEFIIFPKRLKTIRMSDQASSGGGEGEEGEERVTSQLLARTMDGLPVTLDLSFQYRLMPSAESLVKLYKDFQTDYESAYIRIARNVLRDVAADYQAFNYFYNRSVISSAMRGSLDVALMQHSATVQSFQLLNILLPPRFSSAIEETEIARQEIENAGYQQAVSITEANTRVREAERQAKIILLAANATAANITLQARANSFRGRIARALQFAIARAASLPLTARSLPPAGGRRGGRAAPAGGGGARGVQGDQGGARLQRGGAPLLRLAQGDGQPQRECAERDRRREAGAARDWVHEPAVPAERAGERRLAARQQREVACGARVYCRANRTCGL
jgi:regulator of protease activity HflC (stomatin/prohibitin superfamily)